MAEKNDMILSEKMTNIIEASKNVTPYVRINGISYYDVRHMGDVGLMADLQEKFGVQQSTRITKPGRFTSDYPYKFIDPEAEYKSRLYKDEEENIHIVVDHLSLSLFDSGTVSNKPILAYVFNRKGKAKDFTLIGTETITIDEFRKKFTSIGSTRSTADFIKFMVESKNMINESQAVEF